MAVTALSNSFWSAMRFLDFPVLILWLALSHDAVGTVTPNPVLNRRWFMSGPSRTSREAATSTGSHKVFGR